MIIKKEGFLFMLHVVRNSIQHVTMDTRVDMQTVKATPQGPYCMLPDSGV